MKIEEDTISEVDRDTLGPLPPPSKTIIGQNSAPQSWVDTQPPSYNYATQNPAIFPQFTYTSRDNLSCTHSIPHITPHIEASLHSSGT